ncbi:MAG: hypothetical protein RI885_2100 [Actinomycetota bacterium]|jgi:predicted dehydrogenase
MDVVRTVRTGIIGYGLSGRIFHAPFLRADPRFEIEVVSTSDSGRQREAHDQNPRAEVVSRPAEVLNRASDLDLVVLASPAHVHLEQGLAAIEAGCAVVIDKPFAASVAEAEQLIAAAAGRRVPLVVFQNRRWDGDYRTIRAIVASGALGSIHRLESTFERWSPELRDRWKDTTPIARGGGITFDLGSHLIDQALHLFGPASVDSAELSVLRPGGVSDDEAFISLRHRSGVRSHLTLSRMAAQVGPRFRMLGDRGAFVSSGLDGQEAALVSGLSPDHPEYGTTPEALWGALGVAGAETPVPMERGDYGLFYAGVADSILHGAPPPVDAAAALAALAVIERVHEMAASGTAPR